MEGVEMFKKAAEHIAENSGSTTLHAVTDLNSAERFKPLCVVERIKSFWFWKNPTIIPTFVTIKQLLTSTNDLDVSESKREFTLLKNFQAHPTLEVSGSVGAKIAKDCHVDFHATDKMNVVLKLGDIEKNEVSWQKLFEGLENNPINLKHPVYVNAKKLAKTSFCVVMESLSTKNTGTLERDKEVSISTDDGVDLCKTIITAEIHAKGSVEATSQHSFAIPPGTVLAYGCVEFSVDHNGIITLHALPDTVDNSDASILTTPENDAPLLVQAANQRDPIGIIKAEFQSLVNSDNFNAYKKYFKLLLAAASDDDFRVMHILLYRASLYVDGSIDEKSIQIATLQHLIGNEVKLPWKDVLVCLGFIIPSNPKDSNASIELPTTDSNGTLQACMGLVDSIIDLTGNSRKLLNKITDDHIKILQNIISAQLKNEDTSLKDPTVKGMIESDSSTLNFLIDCGFLNSSDDKNMLTYTVDDRSDLLDAFAILYVLSFER